MLQNAIDSIAVGLEDFESSDKRRVASCVRNIFSGILLLFKYKLALMSPNGSDEVLIKRVILPVVNENGAIEFRGNGKMTIDVQQIQDRFKSLGINVDWHRINQIQSCRNDIEHYYDSRETGTVKKIITESFIIIRDFISNHLHKDPKDVLGEKAWNCLVSVAEVYQREMDECVDGISAVDWNSELLLEALQEITCDKCGSDLIEVISGFENCFEAELCAIQGCWYIHAYAATCFAEILCAQ
jgi:hypothetical protein